MSRKKPRYFTAEQKVSILREHLLEGTAVSEVCEKHGLQPSVFYDWQRKLFENGAAALESKPDTAERQLSRKVEALEARLAHKDHVIARVTEELVKENKLGGDP